MRPPVHLLLLGSLLAASCAASQAPEPPCTAARGCGKGALCVAGQCRPGGAIPAPLDASRLLLSPRRLAVVAAGDGAASSEAAAVELGRASAGETLVLLDFAAVLPAGAEVKSAFVVLEPLAGAPSSTDTARVELATILSPWDEAHVSWGRQPRLSPPEFAALARARGAPLRIDVTHLVRDWPRRARDDHGLALIARGDGARGVPFSLGGAGGSGPRLEVYVR